MSSSDPVLPARSDAPGGKPPPPMWRKALITLAILAVSLVLLVRSMMNQQHWSCDVCMAFQDSQSCRKASGNKRDEALRTAIDLACSDIAPGMANGISCTNSQPLKVSCHKK